MPASGARISIRSRFAAVVTSLVALVAAVGAPLASAQSEGGLYIAGAGFSFQAAAKRAMSQNTGGRRFFLLVVPPETAALLARTTGSRAALRDRVVAANGVLLVCQRDIDNGRLNAASLVPGVVTVRGWPPQGSNDLPQGQRYFTNENPANLPTANEALRQLRSTCA
jgi:hypothetical protein